MATLDMTPQRGMRRGGGPEAREKTAEVLHEVGVALNYERAAAKLAALRPQVEPLAQAVEEARQQLDAAGESYAEMMAKAEDLQRRVLSLRQVAKNTRAVAFSAHRDARRKHEDLLREIERLEAVEPPNAGVLDELRGVLTE